MPQHPRKGSIEPGMQAWIVVVRATITRDRAARKFQQFHQIALRAEGQNRRRALLLQNADDRLSRPSSPVPHILSELALLCRQEDVLRREKPCRKRLLDLARDSRTLLRIAEPFPHL